MASPLISSGLGAFDSHGFMDRLAGAWQWSWDGLHVSPRTAPSQGAKPCTYHHWLAAPARSIVSLIMSCLPHDHHRALGLGAVQVGVTLLAC